MSRPFLKMNGLGNDFVVVEAHTGSPHGPFAPGVEAARAIANRETGIGCDQIISISQSPQTQAFVRFWNSDGLEIEACGNGARCVAWLLMEASGRDDTTFETRAGRITGRRAGDKVVTVDMGEPGLDWTDIPLAEDMDTTRVELQVGPIDNPILHTPGCVSMGNPHVVFFVPDAETAPVREVGPMIENHMLFPQGVNVGFAEIKARDRIRLRVWERGAGLTKACGTGACAALVAAHRRGLTDNKATVEFDEGELIIEWRESDDHVLMTGPIAVEFAGVLP
jgi:diaminopimelate epimerase